MKIQFTNTFHQTSTEIHFSTTNKDCIRLDGRKVRRVLAELCGIVGCDCLSDLRVDIDGSPATIAWIDRDADDDQPGIELPLPAPRVEP